MFLRSVVVAELAATPTPAASLESVVSIRALTSTSPSGASKRTVSNHPSSARTVTVPLCSIEPKATASKPSARFPIESVPTFSSPLTPVLPPTLIGVAGSVGLKRTVPPADSTVALTSMSLTLPVAPERSSTRPPPPSTEPATVS